MFGVPISGSDLHTPVQGRSGTQNNMVCLSCKGKAKMFVCVMVGKAAAAPESPVAPALSPAAQGGDG